MPRIQRSPSRRTVAVGVVGLVLLIAAAVAAAVMSSTSSSSTARQVQFGGDREFSPALQKKLAVSQTFAPGETQYEGSQEAGDGASDWAMHSTPGNDISLSVINASRLDWDALKARDNIFDEHGKLANLGPDNAVYPLNQFRNRYVYVPGQYVAAGRTVHSVIDPKCSDTACRLWIANAGGGVWRTDNALAAQPAWTYLSGSFDHNNTAALELDPNDATSNTIYAGTGEANICRSGCLAGVGLYKSKDGGEHWKHLGEQYFGGRGIDSIQVKPGDSSTIFVASGAQGSRGISSTCCNGVDRGANIPDAPHFGVWRSTDGGKTFDLVNQGNATNCTSSTPQQVFLGTTACSPRGASRIAFDPTDPNTVYASFFAKGIWRSDQNGDPGTWTQIFAPLAAPTDASTGAGVERAEFDVVTLPNGDTRMYVGVGGGGSLAARFYRSDSVRTGSPDVDEPDEHDERGLLRPAVQLRRLRLRPTQSGRLGVGSGHRLPAWLERLQPGCSRDVERPRGAAVDGRRRVVHRHDLRQLRRSPAARHPSGPALDRHQPGELEAVLRDE